ncbi:MAG: DUF3043 domain-containing protein [Microlunatus sp.]
MAFFRRNKSEAAQPEPEGIQPGTAEPGPVKKDRPTPSRKEAEAARRARVNRQLSPKQARKETAARNRTERMRALNAREAQPEKVLIRDYVDARFSIGEFLLPALVLILSLSFLNSALPGMAMYATVAMYAYIGWVIIDLWWMWRGLKKVFTERFPRSSTKGLMMYAMNRTIQFRRFRMPAPRIKRGEKY